MANIYVAPLQENYSEALQTPARLKQISLKVRKKSQVPKDTQSEYKGLNLSCLRLNEFRVVFVTDNEDQHYVYA